MSCDTDDAEGSGVSGGPAQGRDVGATVETQCPVEDRQVQNPIIITTVSTDDIA